MKKNQIFALGLLFICILAVSACTSNSAMTGNTSWPGVTVDNDVVYTANGSFIEAVQSGQKVWSYPESANNKLAFYAAPAVNEKYVYAGSYSNQLCILDKKDGTLVVSVEIGNNKNKVIAAPVAADGNVYVLSSGGMVSSYPAEPTGDVLSPNWQTTLSNELWVKPVLAEGKLYVASMDKKMNILNAETGALIQSIDISGAIMSDPLYSEGKLYFSTLAKEVDEMDPETGEIRNLLTTTGEIWASPLLMGDKLIAADMSGYVYCVDVKTGASVWTTEQLTSDKSGFISSPVAVSADSFLLVAENGEMMVYNLDGKSVSQRSLSLNVYTTPVMVGDNTFVIATYPNDGTLRAYYAEMAENWTYSRSSASASATEAPAVTPTEGAEQSGEGK